MTIADKPEAGGVTPHAAYAGLVRQQPVPPAQQKHASAGFAARPEDVAVLLVDDNPKLLQSLREVVQAHGYHQVVEASSGRAALAEMQSRDFDIVLLDLIMPDLSGHDVLDALTLAPISAKVIVVSGDDSFDGVKHALTSGAFDFVKKPYEPAALINAIERALRHRDLERRNDDMEQRLKESEELHRFIVNSSPDLVYILDRNGCFTFLNATLESLLGFDKQELLGRHYSHLVHPDDLDSVRHLFNERRTGERATRHVELRIRSQREPLLERSVNERHVWMEITAMGIYRDPNERIQDGFLGTYGTARDISERKEAEQVINFQAYHDLLTHLPNRTLLKDRLGLAIAQARRNRQRLAVMFLDLDRFKVVNDSLGHTIGDRLLQAVANRLQACLRSGDTLSRYGGDEFTLLLPEVRTRDDVVAIANKILDRLKVPFVLDGHELFVGASIGIAMYPEAGDSVEVLIQNSDIAMYHVKTRGKNGFQFFSYEMNDRLTTRLSLERELRNALTNDELRVFYQPQIDLETGAINGVEALVRWQHPRLGLIAPAEFLPVAMETGLITQIDELVQKTAFSEVAEWRRAGIGPTHLSVNMAAPQLEQADFLQRFLENLVQSGLDPCELRLEITEDTIMQDMETIVPKLRALRAHGIGIAIDDFGTGYSSLSYLQHFPVSALKIDRSFVGDIRAEQGDASIVNAIVSMARGLDLDLIAEGVENRTQLNYLRSRGCREGQGFIFSRAVTEASLRQMLLASPFAGLVRPEIHDNGSVECVPATD
jgi:diguanylate cyclase